MTLVSYSQNNSKTIVLQTAERRVSAELLKQSAGIITARLKTFGVESSVSILSDKNQLKVQIPENTDVSEIKGLLTAKGDLGFFEMLTHKEISDLSGKALTASPSDARLGCSASENSQVIDSVENYLNSIRLPHDYKFIWGLKNRRDQVCLYAIKIRNTGTSPLGQSDIENINATRESGSESYMIGIKFKPAASKIWAITTKNNLGKPIAIVLDDKVLYNPVVKTSIESGLCEITGDMTKKEVNYLLALVNNDPLPLGFTIK
jgi:preprotein translocase subunit SecD